MSSPESSGAPTEGAATSQPAGEFAAAPSFGSTRGSGLARGKRPANSPSASASAPAAGYKPTAIEIVNAPREYQNPFAPATPEPAEAAEAPAAAAPVAAVSETPVSTPVATSVAVETPSPAALPEEKAELNILPPERARSVPAQTWESDGFKARPERAPRQDRQEASAPDAPVDIDSIPPQFLYVRPGVNFVPTPRNWGGAPRERRPYAEQSAAAGSSEAGPSAAPAAAPAQVTEAKSSGGIFGWIKSLFGSGSETSAPATSTDDRSQDRQRGGRGRGHSGQEAGDRGGRHRRHRGGRNRGHRGQRSGGGDSAS